MGNQKEGFLAVKEKEVPAQTQRLSESLVAERPDSFHSIGQDPPSVARTVKSSLLNKKPQITSPNINGSSPKTTVNYYANVDVSKTRLKKNNQRGYRKMKRRVKYGMEVILDLYDCDPKIIRSSKALSSFAIQLCKLIKMKRFGKALTPHFGHDDPKTSGYSLLQFLETSSITGHFSEEYNSAYINIFSCRMFSAKKTIDFTKKYFKTKKAVARKLVRA